MYSTSYVYTVFPTGFHFPQGAGCGDPMIYFSGRSFRKDAVWLKEEKRTEII